MDDDSTENKSLNTLLHVFESIDNNIRNGFEKNFFNNGESDQTYTIINNVLEIRLNLEQGLDDRDMIVKIRIKKPGQSTRSNVRMMLSKKQKDTMIVERVNTIDKPIPVSCLLYLAIVLCTFLRIRIIELFDNNDQLRTARNTLPYEKYRKRKYQEYMKSYTPNGIQDALVYSHNLSFFNDYGFEDKYFNKFQPIFHNCNDNDPDNKQYCEYDDSTVDGISYSNIPPITFILMIRKFEIMENYIDRLKPKLTDIVLNRLEKAEDLCFKLPCMEEVFEGQCNGNGYFKKIFDELTPTQTPTETPKFGYGTNTFNLFPYSANF